MPTGHPEAQAPLGRLQSLDVLRGVAALVVIAWHWQHFFFDPATKGLAVALERQPFYAVFPRLYHSGWLAVDLFFVLSGFVFFALYAAPIAARTEGAGSFVVKRLSRLYPLHLLTFAILVALQWAYMARHGGVPFVYQEFDGYHALLNLAGASSWNLERGYSFNGPFWSVSVELALYAMFFALCRWVSTSVFVVALCAAAGYFLIPHYLPVGRGIYSFFLGGVAAAAYAFLASRKWRPAWEVACVLAAAGAWAVVMSDRLGDVRIYVALPPAFAATVLALAVTEKRWDRATRLLAPLGDISYSVYLIHFPLQVAFVLALEGWGRKADVFYAPATFVAFVAVLVALSLVSHYAFERPARDWLRARLLPARP